MTDNYDETKGVGQMSEDSGVENNASLDNGKAVQKDGETVLKEGIPSVVDEYLDNQETKDKKNRFSRRLYYSLIGFMIVVSLASIVLIGTVVHDYLKWTYSRNEVEQSYKDRIEIYDAELGKMLDSYYGMEEIITKRKATIESLEAEVATLQDTKNELDATKLMSGHF